MSGVAGALEVPQLQVKTIVFTLRRDEMSRPELIELAADNSVNLNPDQIKAAPASGAHIHHLLVCPRMSVVCTTLLSDLGVLGSLDIQEFQLGLIPMEKDVLSLEGGDDWKRMCLVGPTNALLAATILMVCD